MNDLTIKFNRPDVPINTLTSSKLICDNFEHWKDIAEPYPATKNVPTWFKDASQWDEKIGTVPTIKKCPPFLDAMTTGYIIPFCSTAKLTYTKNGHVTKSGDGTMFFTSHVASQYEMSPWKDKPVLKFSSPWVIETPPGWSCLFTHPINDTTSKFKMLSGVVDTDSYRVPVNFPFLLNCDPEETIEFTKQTAMVQVIPFQRTNWKIEVGESNMVQWDSHQKILGEPGSDSYKKNFHQKKKFT
jgi:hypothetical protein